MTITAKDLLIAAGWKQLNGYYTNSERKVFVIRYPQSKPDDNLCDILIRELPEQKQNKYVSNLIKIVYKIDRITLHELDNMVTYLDLLQATAQQKAQALMETYVQR